MRYLVSLTLFACLSCFLSACRPNSQDASQTTSQTRTATTPDPTAPLLRTEIVGEPALGDATVQVYVLQNGQGVSGAQVEVTGDMTHAGMVPVISQAQETEPGLYRSQDFRFTMAGDWFILTEVTLPNGETLRQQLDVQVPSR